MLLMQCCCGSEPQTRVGTHTPNTLQGLSSILFQLHGQGKAAHRQTGLMPIVNLETVSPSSSRPCHRRCGPQAVRRRIPGFLQSPRIPILWVSRQGPGPGPRSVQSSQLCGWLSRMDLGPWSARRPCWWPCWWPSWSAGGGRPLAMSGPPDCGCACGWTGALKVLTLDQIPKHDILTHPRVSSVNSMKIPYILRNTGCRSHVMVLRFYCFLSTLNRGTRDKGPDRTSKVLLGSSRVLTVNLVPSPLHNYMYLCQTVNLKRGLGSEWCEQPILSRSIQTRMGCNVQCRTQTA